MAFVSGDIRKNQEKNTRDFALITQITEPANHHELK